MNLRFLMPLSLALFVSACSLFEEVTPKTEIITEHQTDTVKETVRDTVIIRDTVKVDTFLTKELKNIDVILWQGHSIGDGRGESVSIVPDSTLWMASRTGLSIEMVTTQSTSNDHDDKGSSVRQFAIDYKRNTGRRTVVINSCLGGSDVVANVDLKDWSETGDLWSKSIRSTRNTLKLLKKDTTKLLAIVIDLGINDVSVKRSYSAIKAAYQDLIDRDKAAFPGVTILISQQGKIGSFGATIWCYDLRRAVLDIARENENVHIAMNDAMFIGPNWLVDDVHPNAAALAVKGANLAQWFKNRDLGYSKWANSVISTHFDELTRARKDLVAAFIDSQVANGNYFRLERLINFKTSNRENMFCDWALMGYTGQTKFTWNPNADVQNTAGAGMYYTWVLPSLCGRASADNFICGSKLTSCTTPIKSVAYAFGGADALSKVGVQQTGAALAYYANDLTPSPALAGDIGFASNNMYAVYRNGSEKGLIKNSTTVASDVALVTGTSGEPLTLGGLRLSGNMSGRLAANYAYFFYARYEGFDIDSFYRGIEKVTDNW